MSKIVIQISGMPDGTPTEVDGQYVRDFDFEYDLGRGRMFSTPDIKLAKQFDTMEAAIDYWQTQPKIKPLRWDGRPNRPLTATNMAFIPVPEDTNAQHEN